MTILALCGPMPARAADNDARQLMLAGDASHFPLDEYLSVAADLGGALGIDDIARRDDFRILSLPAPRPGLATGILWYRFTITRAKDMPADWILAFGEPDIDDVRVFVPAEGGGFTETRLGRRIPSRQLPLAARLHVATLDLPEAKPVTIYVRLASEHKIRFEAAALWRPNALLFQEARDSTLYGIHFGILAVIVTVYALFGFWLRDGAMLIYALYVGTIVSRGISHTGIVALIFPDLGGDANYLLTGIGMLGGSAAFIFMWDKILDLKNTFPVMHRIYWLAGAIMAASMLSLMSPAFSFFARSAQATMLIASTTSIVLAILLVRRDPKDVLIKFYLCAFLPVVLVWCAEIGARLSPLIPVDLGRRIDVLATMTHIAILSVALAYRLKRTQREQMRAEAALAGEQLARQRQRTFIDMASHEFKTPLAVIDSAAQMLDQVTAPGRPDITSRTETIRRAVQRLVKLIETCLAGERDDTLALKLQPISPGEIVDQLAERNREPDRADLTVAASGLPKTCLADPDLLGIALDALVDNARRYGPVDHPVEITAQAEAGQVTFVVRDRGPGIPADEAALIFDKYYRCTSSGAAPGTGIGLHLVKTIADLHGGQVSYRPRKGGGASFALTIPTIG